MGGVYGVNLIIGVAGLVMCAIGLVQTFFSRQLEARTRHYFIVFFGILTAYILLNLLGQIADVYSGHGWAIFSRVALFCESLLSSVLTVLLTGFLLQQSGEDRRRAPVFRLAAALWAVYAALLVYTQFTGVFYAIDDNNVYRRGPYYPVLLVPVVLIMLLNLFALWCRRGKLSGKQQIALFTYAAVPMVCMLIQMWFFGVYLIVFGSALGAFAMFTYILTDQTERFYRQQAENERLKMSIVLAQVQPHFLYNTLGAIKSTCRDDRTREAIDQFTKYLRHNMDSLTDDQPISFTQEMEHVRCYLDLQKLRFGSDLRVEYDLECTGFKLPTLTLQPIVENAVTYGVRKSRNGQGLVLIRSRECPDRWEVSVTDDGPGFVPDTLPGDSERSHVGIQNVRDRLRYAVGGELQIHSVLGEGTTVTIILPKGKEET